MVFQIVVKLRRHGFEFGQVIRGDSREVMVLIVVADIERRDIDRAIVAEGLLLRIIGIVLLYPPATHRVQADREEKREHEIQQPYPSAEIYDGRIKHNSTGQ